MKYIVKIVTSISFLLFVCSCEEFLEEEPKNQISVNQFFNEPDDVKSVVNSLYGAGAMQRYIRGDFQINIMLGGYMTGLFENERTERPGPFEANNLTLDPNNMDGYLSDYWSSCYNVISNANTAIKYIPGVEGLSQAEGNKLLAEAKFFRAFNYFALVRDFGDVPLILEPYEGLEDLFLPRTPSETVYATIIDDLEWALANGGLNDVPFVLNGYRVTESAVAVTLANVQLQIAGFPLEGGSESYAKAAEAARTIINGGQHGLIPNGATLDESAYNVLRTSESEDEIVLSLESDEQFRGSNYFALTLPKYAAVPGLSVGDVWIVYRPLDEYIQIYDPSVDLRIQNHQLWYTSIDKDGVTYDFNGNWSPYQWFNEESLYETARSGKDVNINLYSEVLLIAAEAIAQSSGVTNEAVQYLADVRSRAYWQTDRSQIESELNALSKEDFIEEVWKERLRELPLLFKVWSDVQRTKKYPATADTPGEVNFVNVIGHTNPYGATYQEKHMLLPMSARVVERNPELTTNGY